MRVLAFSPLVPALGGSGGQTRELRLLEGLVNLGHDVQVVCPLPADQAPLLASARAAGLRVRTAPRPASRMVETFAAVRSAPWLVPLALTRPLTAWQLEVLARPLLPLLREAIAQRPDVTLVCWDHAAAWLRFLPADLPGVIDLHDASWVYLNDRANALGGLRGSLMALDARRMRRYAARRLPGFDAVTCVSDVDAERVRRTTGIEPVVVDNGVDLGPGVGPEPTDETPTVLFTGTLDYAPNDEAAQWLATDIWPHVRRAVPRARLAVVGRNPSAAVRAFDGRDDIRVPGGVPSMRPWFAAAHVAAVPIRTGGGTRLKILEAAAAGRAIVTTERGAEGLHLSAGTDLVIAPDDPAGFAADLVALLQDEPRRTRLAASARAAVEDRYGWPALSARLADVLARTVRSPCRRSNAQTRAQ